MFKDRLNGYIEMIGCTGKELAELSGISEVAVSRYRTGINRPKPESEEVKKLSRALCSIAGEKGIKDVSRDNVFKELSEACKDSFDYKELQKKLDMLFSVLSVNVSAMAKALNYDPSYISRIRNGRRRPSEPNRLVSDTAEYIARCYGTERDKKMIAALIQAEYSAVKGERECADAVAKWLVSGAAAFADNNPMQSFLKKLNEFDLNQYISAIRFDELKVPTVPFQLPTTKKYFGIEEMKAGELDFLKATALSKSKENVFMYSDMQMDDMAEDEEFAKKYMFGLAAMLKKGLKLNVVHNLNRPFNELMLGLECWIPLYMTGQISPYYLKGVHNQVFCRLLNVSGAAAMAGESISGYHNRGRYVLTKSKAELEYYKERSELVLKKAQPLMEVYREDSAGRLNSFLTADAHSGGRRRNMLSAPPLYTIPKEFLQSFLEKRNTVADERKRILDCAEEQKRRIAEILKNDTVKDEIPGLTEEEFKKAPIYLSASDVFCADDTEYTYEEYLMHLKYTIKYAEKEPNYSVKLSARAGFKNMRIMIHEGEFVMISKSKSPTVHFVIRHPKLREAIEKMELPVINI